MYIRAIHPYQFRKSLDRVSVGFHPFSEEHLLFLGVDVNRHICYLKSNLGSNRITMLQRNLMIGFIALLTVILVYIIMNHIERMKAYDVEIEQIKNKIEPKKIAGIW